MGIKKESDIMTRMSDAVAHMMPAPTSAGEEYTFRATTAALAVVSMELAAILRQMSDGRDGGAN
jgi:hypothetical protein